MKQVLGIFLAILILGCATASTCNAQDLTEPPTFDLAEPMQPNSDSIPQGAFIVPLRLGQVAPEDGVFYSMSANAWLLSEFTRIQQYWIDEMGRRVAITRLWGRHQVNSQQNRYEMDLQGLRIQLRAREREVEDLVEINEELSVQVGWSRREKFRFVVSIVGVAAVAGVVGYVVGITTN